MIGAEPGSIGGGLMKTPEGLPPYVTIYVGVDDLQVALTRAEELGGTTVVEPTPIPGFGAFAWVRDPGGAVIGLFQGPPAAEQGTPDA